MPQSPAVVLTLLVLLAGCDTRTYAAPPPLPQTPTAVPPPPVPEPAPAPETAVSAAPKGKHAAQGKHARAESTPATRESSKPAARPAPPPPPAPKAPAPSAKSAVRVPDSEYVRIDVPSGLQADLDHDPRMQPWVNQALSAIERCYAPLRDTGAKGVIEVRLVMHENARPSAEPGKLPTALTPMLACVTGNLMRTKMPLFTGKEGARYTLKIRLGK